MPCYTTCNCLAAVHAAHALLTTGLSTGGGVAGVGVLGLIGSRWGSCDVCGFVTRSQTDFWVRWLLSFPGSVLSLLLLARPPDMFRTCCVAARNASVRPPRVSSAFSHSPSRPLALPC
ncbi:hypothetical protein BGX38DRAFT_1238152 [Terfezia claveryi]|nr:hypothetical protein BGX38DRAFT_1238152 [Terfezia claveryi]